MMGQDGSGDRLDVALGEALRELEVPEHRPGFHAELRALLREEAARREPVARPHPGRHRWKHGRTSRRLQWGLGLAATASIAAALALLLVVGDLPSPRVASAEEVRATVAEAWAEAQSIQGELVIESVDPGTAFGRGERHWRFILTATGDFRLEDLTLGGVIVYEARKNVQRGIHPSESVPESGPVFASQRRGLAPGPPDQHPATDILDRNLGAVVRALAAGAGGRVREISYTDPATGEQRDAWLLNTEVRVNLIEPEFSPDRFEVTVDRETGFPVRVVATRRGEFLWENRIEGLLVDAPVPPDAFEIDPNEFPPPAEEHATDEGFRRTSLEKLPSLVGYDPLVPTWLPEGYRLAELAWSERGSFTGTEGGNPRTGMVVSLSYRRGLDQFLVTTRLVGEDRSLWSDPLSSGEGFVDEPEVVNLRDGALGGLRAELLIDPLAVPHVWSMTDQLVVTVSGDLTRDELIRVAESLG